MSAYGVNWWLSLKLPACGFHNRVNDRSIIFGSANSTKFIYLGAPLSITKQPQHKD
jgi:hypothetical protein